MSPFHVYADGAEADDPGFIAAVEFFEPYNLREHKSKYSLSCVSGVTSGNFCPLYTFTETSPNNNDVYFRMQVPDGESFNSPSGYTTSNRFRTRKEPLYLVFLSNRNYTTANVSVYPQSGYTVNWTRVTNDNQTVMTPNGFYLITFKFTASTYPSSGTVWATLDLEGDVSLSIIPLYKGPEIAMPDNLHRIVFGTPQTYNVNDPNVVNAINTMNSEAWTREGRLEQQLLQINNNTADSKSYLYDIRTDTGRILNLLVNDNQSNNKATENNNQNEDIKDAVTHLKNTENAIIGDMNTQFEDINTSPNLINENGLLNSMRWVRTQYNRMTDDNIIGSLIQYSLLIGLALMLIGRMK